jgi:hypothetical protein
MIVIKTVVFVTKVRDTQTFLLYEKRENSNTRIKYTRIKEDKTIILLLLWHDIYEIHLLCVRQTPYTRSIIVHKHSNKKLHETYKDISISRDRDTHSCLIAHPPSTDLVLWRRSVLTLVQILSERRKKPPHRGSLLGAWKITWLHSLQVFKRSNGNQVLL